MYTNSTMGLRNYGMVTPEDLAQESRQDSALLRTQDTENYEEHGRVSRDSVGQPLNRMPAAF